MSSTVDIARDFSRTPGGRYVSDGPFSGQLFRDSRLAPALRSAIEGGSVVTVILDGPRGYLSSFLEEAFGGLVRVCRFKRSDIKRHLQIRVNDPFYDTYRVLAERYIDEAREIAVAS